MSNKTNPIDSVIGGHIRKKRLEIGLSHADIADHLDITMQQIEEYETGSCRVSAYKLYAISILFDVELNYFFSGLAKTPASQNENMSSTGIPPLSKEEELELLHSLENIGDEANRTRAIELFKKVKGVS